jgi:polar amino acid transport system substrate-binding protein
MRRLRFLRKGSAQEDQAATPAAGRSPQRTWRMVLGLGLVGLLVVAAAGLATRAVLADRDSTWERIRQTGVWRVGMDPSFPPFENLDGATGQPVGLDVDLANAIASRWGVRAEIVGVGFDELLDAVTAYRVDSAISALPVVEHRTREVAFSAPYVEAGVLLVALRENAIAKLEDLAGRRLAAEWGSAGDAQARVLQREFNGNLTLVLRESPDLALQAVLDGEADAAAVDAVSLALFDAGKDRLITIGEPLQSEPYVIVVPAHAPKLLAAINETLADLAADGTLAAIQARWLEGEETR